MPYISKDIRKLLEPELTKLISKMDRYQDWSITNGNIVEVEELYAYVGLRLLKQIPLKFKWMSRGISGLESAIDEYKETVLRPYESTKRKLNGDVV